MIGKYLYGGENWYSRWFHKPASVGSIPAPAKEIGSVAQRSRAGDL